ncbi:hypothetical protein BS329_32905 [Amycolatopsis coloradensis]|uniref:DUF2637 domain-containing protein n=1 Tax=Amycolatopsis coloradensis TaxID=76021 RepID=A0A1R0KHL7_9PSEU|nr:hypothetical protein [Amycolatopsis coloradensis]OLZ45246.1 hypothetical protein BS329_32905 [Amycolatopsis coloradensis]
MFGRSKSDREDTPGPSRRVRALSDQLDEARDVHRLSTDPMLGAVTADRFRVSITRTMWLFLAIGLGFTTAGVHDFLAGDRQPSDPLWWGAWLAEPALAGILVTLLRWEAAMLSYGVTTNVKPVRYLKRVLLGATLVANVWAGLAPAHGPVSKGMVFFHLVIPLVVFLLAEVMPVIQQTCTQVREQALAATPPTKPASNPMLVEPPATIAPSPRLRLPPEISSRVDAAVTAARNEGREVTTEDIRRAARIPEQMAAQVLAQLTTHNGYKLDA